MSKQIVVCSLFKQSNTTTQQGIGNNHVDNSQKQHTVLKKPYIKKDMLYDFIIGNPTVGKTNLW